jgi:hypothetical protein
MTPLPWSMRKECQPGSAPRRATSSSTLAWWSGVQARQREQVVGQVAAAGRDQGERLVHVRELAWPGVGEDQVLAVLPGDGGGEPVAPVGDHPLDARVGDLPRYVRQRLRQFDGDGRDGRVHASQQERGAQARAGAEFEDGAAGLGGPRGR